MLFDLIRNRLNSLNFVSLPLVSVKQSLLFLFPGLFIAPSNKFIPTKFTKKKKKQSLVIDML